MCSNYSCAFRKKPTLWEEPPSVKFLKWVPPYLQTPFNTKTKNIPTLKTALISTPYFKKWVGSNCEIK